MAKEFLIPHNFKNNGRILNMFSKKAVTKALIIIVPITFIVFSLPINFSYKFCLTMLLGVPPAFFILFELDELLKHMLLFYKNAKIYYDKGKEKHNEYWFEKEKQNSRKSRRKK